MMVIGLPSSTLARVRLRWSMLAEIPTSLKTAERPDRPPWIANWWHDVRSHLPSASLQLLRELAPAQLGSTSPDFLYGATAQHRPWSGASLDEELHALVTTTSAQQVHDELEDAARGDPEAGVPAVPRPLSARLLERGEDVYLETVASAMSAYWKAAIRPFWGRLRSGLDRELDRRGEQLAVHGVASALASLSPHLRLHEDRESYRLIVTGVPCSTQHQRRTATGGLDITASAFLYDSPITGPDISGVEDCYYPARHLGDIWFRSPTSAETSRTSTLADLLGVARAALLSELTTAATTADVAARHGIAASTASYHLGVLHRAGLVTRRRHGRHVFYKRSPTGNSLVES